MKVDINPIVEPDQPSDQYINIETKANTLTGYIKRKTTKKNFSIKIDII